MVHLVHVSTNPGGIEVLLPLIIQSTEQYKFSSFVIRPNKVNNKNIYEGFDHQVSYGSDKNFRALWKLYRYARSNRKEIFHVFNIGPLFLWVIRLAGVKKLVYSIHGTKYYKKKFQKLLFPLIWKLAKSRKYIFTANTAYSKSVFLKKVGHTGRVDLLYNPIDTKRFTDTRIRINQEVRKIIYTGRLAKGKNLFKWIDIAIQLIQSYNKDLVFEIYGEGPLKKSLIDYVTQKRYEEKIKIKGFRQDIENVYKIADLLLFLSEYESFGNVVVESTLCGTPVIASDIPSMQEIFKEDNYPLVSLNENLYSEIKKRLVDYQNLLKVTNSLKNDFAIRFSEKQHIKALNNIYSDLYV